MTDSKTKREAEQAEFEQEFNGGLKLPPAEDVSTLTDAVKKSEAVAPSDAQIAEPVKTAAVPDKADDKAKK